MSIIVAKTRNVFSFLCPVNINFGVGVAAGVPDHAKNLGISKVMVVTDNILASTHNGHAVIESLKMAGLNPVVWSEVVPDPTDTSIETGAKVYLDERCDGLIAMGGGSHMDTAKCIGVLAMNGKKIGDYFSHLPDPAPIRKVPPLICMPTTAGTGAEVTNVAVVTSSVDHRKVGVAHPLLAPAMALIDPALTLTLPPLQTAATGLDTLCHAVEGYLSLLETPITDALALYALELISNNLRKVVADGSDIEARTNMSLAALLSGMVINTCYATAGHASGQAIGGKYPILHGLSCSLILPAVLEYNMPSCMEKLNKMAAVMGVAINGMSPQKAAEAAIAAISQIISDLNVPTLSQATGMKMDDLVSIAEIAVADGCNYLNPRSWTTESYVEIFKKALSI